jgi:hypothetical protein
MLWQETDEWTYSVHDHTTRIFVSRRPAQGKWYYELPHNWEIT